jgi:hypothetical protein
MLRVGPARAAFSSAAGAVYMEITAREVPVHLRPPGEW